MQEVRTLRRGGSGAPGWGGHCSELCRWQEGEPVRGSRSIFQKNYIVGKVEDELITEGKVGPGDQKKRSGRLDLLPRWETELRFRRKGIHIQDNKQNIQEMTWWLVGCA